MANWSGIASTANTGAQSATQAPNSGGTASAISALIPFIGPFLSSMFSADAAGAGQQMTPEMREIMKTQLARMRTQEPLYQDVMGMARSLLPTRYRVTQGNGQGSSAWDGLRQGEDLRQPTANAQQTGRYAVPRNTIDDVILNRPGGRTPRER